MIHIKGYNYERELYEIKIDIANGESFNIVTFDKELVVETRHDNYWFRLEGFEINTVKDVK